MLFEFEATGKTIEKAIENALFELKAVREDVDIKILEQGGLFKKARVLVSISEDSRDKYAKREQVRKELVSEEVETVEETTDVVEEIAEETNETLEEVVEITKEEKKEIKEVEKQEKKERKELAKKEKKQENISAEKFVEGFIEVSGCGEDMTALRDEEGVKIEITGNKASDLIGYRGECLNALQYIASVIENENSENRTRVMIDIENYRAKREETLKGLADRMAKKVLRTGKSVKLEPMCANDRRIIHTALQNVDGVSTVSKGSEPNRFLIILPSKEE